MLSQSMRIMSHTDTTKGPASKVLHAGVSRVSIHCVYYARNSSRPCDQLLHFIGPELVKQQRGKLTESWIGQALLS